MKRYSIKVNGRLFDVEVEEVTGEKTENAAGTAGAAGRSENRTAVSGGAEENKLDEKDAAAAVHRARTPKTPKKKEEPARMPEGISSQEDSLTSPMPGTVLKICVSPGDEVYAGETLIILEAMKMENEINSHKTGKIGMIAVKEGDAVNTGDVLLTVE